MKIMVWSLSVVLSSFFSLTVAQAQTGNLIRNGNFERAAQSTGIQNWSPNCPHAPVLTSAYRKFDKRSLVIDDPEASRACAVYSQTVAVEAGKSYVIDAWARWTLYSGTSGSPGVFVVWYAKGVEIKRISYVVPGAVGVWNQLRKFVVAPAGATTAQVLLYSGLKSSARVQFDGIYFGKLNAIQGGQVTRYVSYTGYGAGNGLTRVNAAKYNNPTFWNSVKTQLRSTPVRVVFVKGRYTISKESEALIVSRLGDASRRLVLTGEDANSVQFVAGSAMTTKVSSLVRFDFLQNAEISNIHFRSVSKIDVGYFLQLRDSKKVSLENITGLDLVKMAYGVIGIHHNSSDIKLSGSEFLRTGYDGHQHFIYAFRNVSNVVVNNSVFEDSTGAYIRCRDRCSNFRIQSSDFYSSYTWGPSGYRNSHFIEWAAFNDDLYRSVADASAQEFFASNGFSALSNRFTYKVKAGRAIPFSIVHTGYKPYDGTQYRNHLLTASHKSTLLNGTPTTMRSLILSKFKIDMGSFAVRSNTFKNNLYHFELQSEASYGAKDYYPSSETAGSGSYDISETVGLPAGS
ncbi:MAG: hypothetical protein ACAH59_08495 [Pseudobdellovibrionaceae bacterium]